MTDSTNKQQIKNVLVAGGAGFIGSNFVHYLLEKIPDVKIINLDLLTYAGSRQNLEDVAKDERHIFVHGDICNADLVQQLLVQYDVDTIINFAAETHVDRSINTPADFVHTNITGTFTLLESARRFWTGTYDGRRFHHVSSDEVFGTLEADAPAWTESSPYRPRSPYAASKASADHLARAYFTTYGMPVTVSICSNNYGPYQFPEKLIPLTILNALRGKQIPLYGDGRQIRDWIFVLDHCKAIHQIVTMGTPGEFYNVSGQTGLQNSVIVRKICDILDELHPLAFPHANLIAHVPDRPGHDRRYALDISKIRREMDWLPRYDLETGLRKTVEWYMGQHSWASNIVESREYAEWIERNYGNRNPFG